MLPILISKFSLPNKAKTDSIGLAKRSPESSHLIVFGKWIFLIMRGVISLRISFVLRGFSFFSINTYSPFGVFLILSSSTFTP